MLFFQCSMHREDTMVNFSSATTFGWVHIDYVKNWTTKGFILKISKKPHRFRSNSTWPKCIWPSITIHCRCSIFRCIMLKFSLSILYMMMDDVLGEILTFTSSISYVYEIQNIRIHTYIRCSYIKLTEKQLYKIEFIYKTSYWEF